MENFFLWAEGRGCRVHRSLPTFVDAAERVAECCRWQASLQYLVLHLLHLFL